MWKKSHEETCLLKVRGSDTEEWLNRICSQKLGPETRDSFRQGAFLDYKAQALACFTIWHRCVNSVDILFAPEFRERIAEFLTEAHFSEDIVCEYSENLDWDEWIPEYVEERSILSSIKGSYEGDQYISGNSKFLKKGSPPPVGKYKSLDRISYNLLRCISGFPFPRSDFYGSHIMIESESFEAYAHDNKGCYPGQEVINKIRSIGQVPKKFCCFQIYPRDNFLSKGEKLKADGGFEISVEETFEWEGEKYFTSYLRPKFLSGNKTQFPVLSEKNVDFFVNLMNVHKVQEA